MQDLFLLKRAVKSQSDSPTPTASPNLSVMEAHISFVLRYRRCCYTYDEATRQIKSLDPQ